MRDNAYVCLMVCINCNSYILEIQAKKLMNLEKSGINELNLEGNERMVNVNVNNI